MGLTHTMTNPTTSPHMILRPRADRIIGGADTCVDHAVNRSHCKGGTVLVHTRRYASEFAAELDALGAREQEGLTLRGNRLFNGPTWQIELGVN